MRENAEIREILHRVVTRLAAVRGLSAIVLGGSRVRGTADAHSDIDLGLYYDSRRPLRIADLDRAARNLDDRHMPGLVTPFGAWGPGVNGGGWLQVGGHHLDFLYRDIVAVRRAIDECRAGTVRTDYQLGHPLGFHNQIYPGEVNCCRPIYDPRGTVRELKLMVARYPEKLRRTIVKKHLFDAAFELEIADTPAARGDAMYVTGCLFRAAGFMTLVVHALNRRWLINEKGALAATRSMKLRPRGFDRTIAAILARPRQSPHAMERSLIAMKQLHARLETVASRAGLEVSGFGP